MATTLSLADQKALAGVLRASGITPASLRSSSSAPAPVDPNKLDPFSYQKYAAAQPGNTVNQWQGLGGNIVDGSGDGSVSLTAALQSPAHLKAAGLWNPAWDSWKTVPAPGTTKDSKEKREVWNNETGYALEGAAPGAAYRTGSDGSLELVTPEEVTGTLKPLEGFKFKRARASGATEIVGLFDPSGKQLTAELGALSGSGSLHSSDYAQMASVLLGGATLAAGGVANLGAAAANSVGITGVTGSTAQALGGALVGSINGGFQSGTVQGALKGAATGGFTGLASNYVSNAVGATGSTAAGVKGAVGGAINALINGGDSSTILKNALIGGISNAAGDYSGPQYRSAVTKFVSAALSGQKFDDKMGVAKLLVSAFRQPTPKG